MENSQVATLEAKIQSQIFDTACYPRLSEFCAGLSAIISDEIAKLTRKTVRQAKWSVAMSAYRQFVGSHEENSVNYWIAETHEDCGHFVSLSPNFVYALGDCLMGADFNMQSEHQTCAGLDAALALPLVENVNEHLVFQIS